MTLYCFIPIEAEAALKNVITDNMFVNKQVIAPYYVENTDTPIRGESLITYNGIKCPYGFFNSLTSTEQKLLCFLLIKQDISNSIYEYLQHNGAVFFNTAKELLTYIQNH